MRGRTALPLLGGLVAMLGGCAAQTRVAAPFFTGSGPADSYMVPVRSMVERKFDGIVRQKYDFSCGSAALATLLRYHYGDAAGEDTVFLGMWRDGDRTQIRRLGFSLLDMKRYLAARGLESDGYKVTLDQIAKTGVPGIALVTVRGYRHFVVIKGVHADEVLIGDPSAGLTVMTRPAFEKLWNGVYFVLTSERDRGSARFNRTTQWAAYQRAPISGRFSDPVSLQALALTAPFYRDY